MTRGGLSYLVDVWRRRVDYPTLKERLAKRWNAQRVLVEDAGTGTSLVQELRGKVSVLRMPSGKVVWDTGYGPTKTLAASLVPEKRAALERDFIAMHEKYRTPAGLAMPREYLVTIGVRK